MALAGGTCWGFSGCCGQYLFEQKGIEAPWLVAVRLFFAGIILVLAGFKLHGRDNLRVFRKKRDTIHLLAFAIFGITFCQFTYFMAIQASNAGTATVLQYLSPIHWSVSVWHLCYWHPRGHSLLPHHRGGPVLGSIGSCELHDLYHHTGRTDT